jgi:SSS family solute:Na+ symporter
LTIVSAIIMGIAILYVVVVSAIGFYMKKFSGSTDKYVKGGKTYIPLIIGVLMMSEFIGTAASIGTAQEAYTKGISVSLNLITLGIGFALFAYFLAKKFHDRGEYTISGAIAKTYGKSTKLVTSLIMIFAMEIVAVSVYASGGAAVSGVLHIPNSLAVVIVGLIAVLYVSIGGMSAVVYTNLIHASFKYLAIIIAVSFALVAVGGFSNLTTHLKPNMFSFTNVGWPQIIAWLIANIGSVFSTQYIIQAIAATDHEKKAKKASLYAGLLIIPFGILAAIAGMCSLVLFPHIKPIQAFPALLSLMNPFFAGIVVAGLVASLFGTISALTIGSATLLLKDFYQPLFHKEDKDVASLRFVRIATIAVGLLPIPFALFSTHLLVIVFLARALRTSLAILVILMFYTPKFGNGRGATWGLILSLIFTIGWYAAGNPFGIDNTYVATVTPIIVMAISHLFKSKKLEPEVNHNNHNIEPKVGSIS